MSKPTYEELEKRVKELEKIEQSLQASEEKYRSVFDSVGSSIVIVDKDGIITDINPHHVENIGKGKTTKDDYIGKNIIEHPSVVKAGISKLYRKVLEGETIEQKDVYFPSLTGGGDGYYNIKSSPLKEDNKIIGAVMVHEDVTEIKIHRENLEGLIEERTNEVHENEKLFRLLMDSTSDGYFDHNLITDEVYYGEKCEEMLGYAPGEIKHHLSSWQSLLHPEDVPGITKEVKDLLEGKTDRFVQEYRFRNKTDDWQWLLSRAKIVEWDDDGRPTRLVGTHQDITERKKAEEALRFNEERFRSLFSSSTAGIAFTTLDGQFVDVNEAYLKILGYTVEELKKLTYSDLTPGKWHKMETGILSEAINTGHTRNFEKEYIGKDGTIIPVFVNACVMKDLEGNANRLGA
ncbi:MAG: PAS domain S-box protein, partial [bacterium]|nr:PAS domain S-box protein [bacterium]